MKFKSIGSKMLAGLLPVIVLAMFLLTVISANSSKSIINAQISSRMDAELEAQEGMANEQLNAIASMTNTLAHVVANNYKSTKLGDYMDMMCDIISDNDNAYGSGIWFEANLYNPQQEYVAPYVYKEDGEPVTSYDYSNGKVDYFSMDFYTMAKESETKTASFTQPVYNSELGCVMTTCASPIYVGTKFVGCTTVDMQLDVLNQMMAQSNEGNNNTALLIAADGTYLAGVEDDKIASGLKISEEENASLAKAAETILAEETGIVTYSGAGGTYNLYFSTVDSTGWKFIMQIPQSELTKPVNNLIIQLILICIIAVAVVIVVISRQIRSISKNIARVKTFAGSLAGGDFTVDPLTVKTRDELGVMGDSLNEMYSSNRGVITNISEHAEEIGDASTRLKNAAEDLSEKFEEIQRFMVQVNDAMVNTSSATQQVNASTEEVLSNVNLLANETQESTDLALEIRRRAGEIRKNSQISFQSATELGQQFEANLNQSIENAKVVSSIGKLADVISEIAEQINLLALNASIEAARAGDAGRGFAVVASEIGSLAGNTTEAVSKIQETVSEVQKAFGSLTSDAQGMLGFLVDTVTPDYSSFVEVAEQYGRDAEAIEESASNISNMSDSIKTIMQEVTDAIQDIAEATHSTSEVSGEIMAEIEAVGDSIGNVSEMSEKQQGIASDLNSVVGKFTLK